MKTFVVLFAACAFSATALSAQHMALHMAPGYFATEFKAVELQLADRTLGDLKVSELIPLAERLDVARQKDSAVKMATMMSYMMPGAALFRTGDFGLGAAQAGLSLGVLGGSLYWANTLLPADVQVGSLDYFATSHTTIVGLWKAHTFNELAPALGAAALGGVVDMAIRLWSAKTGHDAVKAAIDANKLEFQPHLSSMGFGMGMRY